MGTSPYAPQRESGCWTRSVRSDISPGCWRAAVGGTGRPWSARSFRTLLILFFRRLYGLRPLWRWRIDSVLSCATRYEKLRIMLQHRPQPTAVVCGNDLIALGVASAFRDAGLRCPQDVSVVGFVDIEVTELTNPSLTTVFQPGYQMGARGAALLIKRMQAPHHPAQNIVLPTELKVRHSVASPEESAFWPKNSRSVRA